MSSPFVSQIGDMLRHFHHGILAGDVTRRTSSWRQNTHPDRQLENRKPLPSFTWLVLLAWFCCTGAFATDFSGPLQDVQVAVNGSTVSYQVFDPEHNFFAQGSATTPASYIST